jgi:hypothetical protein
LTYTLLVLHTLQQLCTHTQASQSILGDQQTCQSSLSAQPHQEQLEQL